MARKQGFVPSPMIRTKSLKTLAKNYEDLSNAIARLQHKQDLIRGEIQALVGIDHSTVAKLGPGEFVKVQVIKQVLEGYDKAKLERLVPASTLKKCRRRSAYVRVLVGRCDEDVYKSYFEEQE